MKKSIASATASLFLVGSLAVASLFLSPLVFAQSATPTLSGVSLGELTSTEAEVEGDITTDNASNISSLTVIYGSSPTALTSTGNTTRTSISGQPTASFGGGFMTGLSPSTMYYYQLVAVENGQTYNLPSVPTAFTTKDVSTAGIVATTSGATVTITGNVGSVLATSVNVFYGTDATNFSNTESGTVVPNGLSSPFSLTVSSLAPGTYYYSVYYYISGSADPILLSGTPAQTFVIGTGTGTGGGTGTTTVTNLASTPGSDGKSETITGDITTGGYDEASLKLAYSSSTASGSAVADILTSTPAGDTFTATVSNLAPGSYTYNLLDKNNSDFPGSSGTFVIDSTAGTGTGGVVTNLVVTPGADGMSETITGSITTGGYNAASLAVDYGVGLSQNLSAPVTITASAANGTDGFTASLANLPAGTYSYSMSDDNTISFTGSTGTFTISAPGTTAGGGSAGVAGGGTSTAGGTAGTATAGTTPTNLSPQFQIPNPIAGSSTLNIFLGNILSGVILVLTPVLVIMLLYAGFLFVSAQGNTEKLGDAKKALLWTLVGAAILLGAKELATLIGNTVGALTS